MRSIVQLAAFIGLGILGLHCGCKKDPVSPSQKNLRELTWRVDTLAYPGSFQTLLSDIWGSSAKDVYVVGSNSNNRGLMWHFDGKSWTDVKLGVTQGGTIVGAIDLRDIYGFGPNNIWAVGDHIRNNPNPPPNFLDSSLLIHFDGGRWEEIPTPAGRTLTAVWGRSSNDLWMAGWQGTLFHYDGVTVKKEAFPLTAISDADTFYVPISIVGNASEGMYMLVADNAFGGRQFFFLQRENDRWVVTDNNFFFHSSGLWMSPSGTLYVSGQSVYKRQSGGWNKTLDGFNTLYSIGIHGTDDSNIFAVGRSNVEPYPGAIYHYNGNDWFNLQNLNILGVVYAEVWTDGREVFVVGTTGQKSIVLHGK
jgi:hypothetical protein